MSPLVIAVIVFVVIGAAVLTVLARGVKKDEEHREQLENENPRGNRLGQEHATVTDESGKTRVAD
ncbi:hypothetical protein HJD18_11425 [Thermoleophilia bacterium SCSIO 60948]|nr:hypothetical protein HJD18_11425 [Thermoleophilia bacterium SCSIO 60948]